MAEKLQEKLDRVVLACFLEKGEPNIPQGVDAALNQNPSEILALPYFLIAGVHVIEDISSILSEKARAYPETPIKILDYVGKNPQMIELLSNVVERKM